MAETYYCVDSENGQHIDDPSEDALTAVVVVDVQPLRKRFASFGL
ncbi:hypothetical protein AB0F30_35650 [Streptomyces sp. NPDC029006]